MSAEIRQIVARTWTDYIGVPQEWSSEQTEEFFTEEATRMADRIARMQAEAQLVVIRQWRDAHHGNQPDYLTQVGLINSARAQCQEIVLSEELYEQIPEDSENSEEEDELQAAWEAQVEREQWYGRLPEGNEPWKVAVRAKSVTPLGPPTSRTRRFAAVLSLLRTAASHRARIVMPVATCCSVIGECASTSAAV